MRGPESARSARIARIARSARSARSARARSDPGIVGPERACGGKIARNDLAPSQALSDPGIAGSERAWTRDYLGTIWDGKGLSRDY